MRSVRSRQVAVSLRGSVRGVALVAVLWMIAILTILVAGILHSIRADISMNASALEAARARALLDGALRLAAADIAGARQRPVAPYSVEYEIAGHRVRVDVSRESGFISVNSAPESLLRDLFMFGAGVPEREAVQLAQRVIDWRDADDERHAQGAEWEDYRTTSLSHGPRNEDFLHPDDLGQVLGMTGAVHANIRGLVSVLRGGGAGRVNPRTAPAAVLEVLARGNQEVVNRILAAQEAGDAVLAEVGGLDPRHTGEWFGNQFRLRAVLEIEGSGAWGRTASMSLDAAHRARTNSLPWHWLHADQAGRIFAPVSGN